MFHKKPQRQNMHSALKKFSIGATVLLLVLLCSTFTSQSALAAQVFTWNQGNNPTSMIRERSGACFLTSIQGKFEGDKEKVEISRQNGQWFLGGSSDQFGVSAEATCVQWNELVGITPAVYGPYILNQDPQNNQAFRYLDSFNESDSICFLGSVSGKFRGGGENVEVTTNPSTREWKLNVDSQQFGVAASAYCIPSDLNFTKLTNRFDWAQDILPVPLGSSVTNAVCFLTRMTGKFQGDAEKVRAYTNSGDWYLGGSSNQSGVRASARCFKR